MIHTAKSAYNYTHYWFNIFFAIFNFSDMINVYSNRNILRPQLCNTAFFVIKISLNSNLSSVGQFPFTKS